MAYHRTQKESTVCIIGSDMVRYDVAALHALQLLVDRTDVLEVLDELHHHGSIRESEQLRILFEVFHRRQQESHRKINGALPKKKKRYTINKHKQTITIDIKILDNLWK